MEENFGDSVNEIFEGRPQCGHEQLDPETEEDNPETALLIDSTVAHLRTSTGIRHVRARTRRAQTGATFKKGIT